MSLFSKWKNTKAHKFGGQFSVSRQLHHMIKRQKDVASGKEAGKQAEWQQVKSDQKIAEQQKKEQLRLAEQESEIKRRKLASLSSNQSLFRRTLG